MDIKILQKRSAVANASPSPAVLEHGELAVNYHDMKVYFKDSTGVVRILNDWATIHNKPTGLNNVTSTNTADTIPLRDSNGNFAAGIITATLNGSATTAIALQTPRSINGTLFDGTTDITIAATTMATLTRGIYLTGSNFDGSTATTWAVDASSASIASKIVARDSFGNFAAGTITAALTGNASTATALQTPRLINGVPFDGSADITVSAGGAGELLTPGSYLTGSAYDGSTPLTWAVDATALNTASTIVARDASGNFAAGTITAALTGNASTATALQTSRTISLGGVMFGSATFDGTSDITIMASKGDMIIALGTDTTGSYVATVGTSGVGISASGSGGENAAVTITSNATALNTPSTIVARDASGNFSAGTITAALTGNASTATALQTARTISLSGDATGSVSFNGTADVDIAVTVSGGGGGGPQTIVSLTGASNTLLLAHAEAYVRVNHTAATTLNVPTNAVAAFPVGTAITIRQVGAGQITIAGAGVTINTSETLRARKQGSSIGLIKVATDEWDLTGDLEAA